MQVLKGHVGNGALSQDPTSMDTGFPVLDLNEQVTERQITDLTLLTGIIDRGQEPVKDMSKCSVEIIVRHKEHDLR